MSLSRPRLDEFAAIWFGVLNLLCIAVFAFDKWLAGRGSQRVPEKILLLLAALGGWPGGLLAMNLFRHKTAKLSFKVKYAVALIPFAAAIWSWWRFR
jgi:uncharacterized membrane protein YsdA (DUF1294 family)